MSLARQSLLASLVVCFLVFCFHEDFSAFFDFGIDNRLICISLCPYLLKGAKRTVKKKVMKKRIFSFCSAAFMLTHTQHELLLKSTEKEWKDK